MSKSPNNESHAQSDKRGFLNKVGKFFQKHKNKILTGVAVVAVVSVAIATGPLTAIALAGTGYVVNKGVQAVRNRAKRNKAQKLSYNMLNNPSQARNQPTQGQTLQQTQSHTSGSTKTYSAGITDTSITTIYHYR